MKPKKRILYSNYELDYNEAKEWLIDQHLEAYPDNEIWEPTDSEVWEELNFQDSVNCDVFMEELERFIYGHYFILQGTIGTWCGVKGGGFIFSSINELCTAWNDCDYLEFYDENGHLYIRCSHHDGDNYYEIKMLTQKGEEYHSNHYYDDNRTLHNRLMKSPFSVLPNFANKVWGCKVREYETKKGGLEK